MMEAKELLEWLDRHHVEIIRTHATTLDGPGIGKYLNRHKFLASLNQGHAISDMALTMDITGFPHMTMWHQQREPNLGDIFLKPDISTLVSDGTDPDLGHIICDFTNASGQALDLCPRSTLKRLVADIEALGFGVKSTFELEFYLFKDSFDDIHLSKYKRLNPVTATHQGGIYNLRNAHLAKPFMKQLTKRLDWQGIKWEGWNDEAGVGQLELNLEPTDPVHMADNVVRTKQALFETAVEMEMAVTFMAKLGPNYGSGMHAHHSLFDLKTQTSVFYDDQMPANRSQTMLHWLAGIVATLPGAVSYLCPTVNAYRRFSQYAAVPMTATWGEDNKSTAIRTLSGSEKSARIEHRVASGDVNPYLAMATILAGGLAGLKHQLEPPEEFTKLAWGLPPTDRDLPRTITTAAKALKADDLLKEILGPSNVDYWAKTREAEWLAFHTEGGDPNKAETSLWEFQRYFALV